MTVPPGRTVERTLTQWISGLAPSGTYTHAGSLGTLGGVLRANDSFPVIKKGALDPLSP